MKSICNQAGIGLLRVPAGSEKVRVEVELCGGKPIGICHLMAKTIDKIKGLDQLAVWPNVYPSSLRDTLSLFPGKKPPAGMTCFGGLSNRGIVIGMCCANGPMIRMSQGRYVWEGADRRKSTLTSS